MAVYIDLIFIENLVINYAILLSSAMLLKQKPMKLRLLGASALGAGYVFIPLAFPEMHVAAAIAGKLLLAAAMVMAAFKSDCFRDFMKNAAIFFMVTCIYAGVTFALIFAVSRGVFDPGGAAAGLNDSGGVPALLAAGSGAFVLIALFYDTVNSRLKLSKAVYPVNIFSNGKQAGIRALMDTGHNLRDPVSGLPVVIVELERLTQLLSPEQISVYRKMTETGDIYSTLSQMQGCARTLAGRFCLIPYQTVGTSDGMLAGYRPDYITIGNSGKKVSAVLGIMNHRLSYENKYDALLSTEAI